MSRRHLAALQRWDYYFDQGAAASVSEDSGNIRITPRMDWNSQWAWYAIKLDRMGGKTPHFVIAKASHFNMVSGEYLAVWATSPDTDNWNIFDNVTIGATDLEFYNNAPFPNGTIYVAHLPMHPYQRTQRKVAEWLNKPTLVSTLSGIGQATRRPNGDGRVAPGMPYLGVKVTNATENTKNNGILTSGNHPSELIGRFILEGAVDWLLTTSVKQKFLLDWFNFYVYPCLNPQGIVGGWFRSSPQTPASDNNRLWDGTGVNEAVDAFKAEWTARFTDTFEVAFDYHSWMAADGAKSLAYDSTIAIWVAFLAKMAALDATFVKRTDDTTASMLGNYWRGLAITKLAGHIDHGSATTLGIADWKTNGQNTMIALANMLADGQFANGPGVGSRDFNGTTDRIDWANAWNPSGSALTISAWVMLDAAAANMYILCCHDSGNTQYGIVVNNIATGDLDFVRHGATDYLWFTSGTGADWLTTGTWHHILITSDGGLLSGSVVMYIDGTSRAVGFTNGSGAETAHTGSWSLGGRIYSDTRNFDGHIAQAGVWDRVLTAGEIANLAAGYAPDLVDGGSNLKFYFKGNTSSLINIVSGVTGTADGTTQVTGVGNGPSIIYG